MGSTLTANIDINDQGKAVVASLWIDGAEPIINVGCPEGQGLQVSITVGVLSVVSYSQLDVFNALPVDIQSDIIQSLLGRPPLGDSTDERWQCECMGCQIARQLNASKTNEYVEHN